MLNKKILVIGSNSFSGASFCEYLLNNGHEVFGASRSNLVNPVFHEKLYSAFTNKSFKYFQIDINENFDDLTQTIKKEKINIIVNFAAQSMVGESWESPLDWLTTNICSLTKLIKYLENSDSLEQFIQFSTPEVYGSTDTGWIEEGRQFNPSTPYAVSRAAGDMMLKIYHSEKSFPVKFTRAANVYGKGQPLYRIIPRTIFSMLTPNKLQLHGGGKSIRSFIHIEDVNTALVKIIDKGNFGEDYHISTNELISIKDLVKKICEVTEQNFQDKVNIVPERPGKDQTYALGSKKLRSELKWKDEISLTHGLKEVVAWIYSNIDELKKQPLKYSHKK